MPDIIDAINLKGTAFCIEYGLFEYAEEMLAELSPAGAASSAAAALRRRIRDAEIAFWKMRSLSSRCCSSRWLLCQ